MAFEKTKIRVVSNSTIVLSDMDTQDEAVSLTFGSGYKSRKVLGYEFPYILINDYRIKKLELSSFEIDCSNFLPILHMKLVVTNNEFIAQKLPKDGDVASIYIRSYNDVYKPIRNDYLITHVETTYLNDIEPATIFYITGILNIKKIWVEQNKAFKGTSIDVIKKVASELQLGFATNIEEPTDDEMVWICDWKSYKDYILHITNHSWRNENTFYQSFIDVYYNVNFIEVEKQFDQTKQFDEALAIFQRNVFDDADPFLVDDKNPVQANKKTDLILTNIEYGVNYNFKITNYELVNNSSAISYSQGYGKKMYFYDHTLKTISEENMIEFNPLSTPGTEDTKIRLRGLKDETIEKEHLKNIWNGIQYSLPNGNVHQKYALAFHQNYTNNKELEKMYIDIDLWGWNPAVVKMERVPILIFITDVIQEASPYMSSNEIQSNKQDTKIPLVGLYPTVDRFLSGFFVVEGFKIVYDVTIGRITAKYKLTRREWGVPQSEDIF
jgi:hypothetical protein